MKKRVKIGNNNSNVCSENDVMVLMGEMVMGETNGWFVVTC